MNTVTEIEAALAEMVVAMTENGVVTPEAHLTLKGDQQKCYVALWSSYSHRAFDGKHLRHFYGDTPAEAIKAARAYIAALPSPEETGVREYMRKVADAIDTGAKHGIADEYVAPLRGVNMAMTDNLLTHEPAQ